MYNKKSWIVLAMPNGLIFDIQRFSVNDGPGIRTTVFFKGCGLRCRWCHNPESIASYQQVNYDPERCNGCGKCVEFVHGEGIRIIDQKAVVDFTIHDRNLDLIDICPKQAFECFGREYSVQELITEVMKDADYYENSDGGVTFSGGEALNQWPFIFECAKILKSKGIHLTLDVSGNDPQRMIAQTTELIDLYLVDYKLSQDELYTKYIGYKFDPEIMLTTLAKAQKPVILRCILIPGVNDTADHFSAIKTIGDRFSNIIQIDLLPYHKMKKRQQFHLINNREFYPVPDDQTKTEWIEKVNRCAIQNAIMDSQPIIIKKEL